MIGNCVTACGGLCVNLLNLMFPRICVGCGWWGRYICANCLNLLSIRWQQMCPYCERPSPTGMTHSTCQRPTGLDGLMIGFEYQGLIKSMIGTYKYHLVSDLAGDLFELLVSLPEWQLAPADWLVTAVPLHPSRFHWRGFNQSELLSRRLATYLNTVYVPMLFREKYTRVQMELAQEDRYENVRQAFTRAVAPEYIRGQSIILLDDVWTTGATMTEAARPLKRAGAAQVWGLVLAA